MYYYLRLLRKKKRNVSILFSASFPSQSKRTGKAPQMDFPRFEFQDLPSPGTKVGAAKDRKNICTILRMYVVQYIYLYISYTMIYYVYRYLRYDLKSDTYIRDEHIASLQKCIRGEGTEGRSLQLFQVTIMHFSVGVHFTCSMKDIQ